MISGKKLMKIGWYMLALPLIALFLSIAISAVLYGSENAVNPVTRLVGALLALSWVLAIFPLTVGLVMVIAERIARKRRTAAEKPDNAAE
jgi:predicted branched-subunit amino acid permease